MQREFYINLLLVIAHFLSYDLKRCIEFSKQSNGRFLLTRLSTSMLCDRNSGKSTRFYRLRQDIRCRSRRIVAHSRIFPDLTYREDSSQVGGSSLPSFDRTSLSP